MFFIFLNNSNLFKNFEYFKKKSSLYFIFELKFELNFIPLSKFNFISPSDMIISSNSPKIFFIKISFLSAKKFKFAFVKFKSSKNLTFKSFTEPLTIKFSIKFFSFKNISISENTLPSLTLLINKLLKFEGFITADILFISVISNSFKIRLIFFIFSSEFIRGKKSKYTIIFCTGKVTSL